MGKYGHDFISSSSLISSYLSWRLIQSLSHLALTYQFLRYLSLEGFIKQWPSNDVSTTTTPLIGGKAGNTECQNENPSPHSSQMTMGARFSKVPRTFRARKAIRKITTCLFCKARFFCDVKGIKLKINAKFRASTRLRFEDTKRIMSPEIRPKNFGTFDKRAPGLRLSV